MPSKLWITASPERLAGGEQQGMRYLKNDGTQMIAVSGYIERELWERARDMGINISLTVREAIEVKIREAEVSE